MNRANHFRFIAALLILGSTLGLAHLADRRPADTLAEPLDTLPATLGSWWASEDRPVLPRVAEKLKATTLVSRAYKRGSQEISVFIAHYARQRAGESIHSPKNCLPGTGWTFLSQTTTVIPVEGKAIRVNLASIQGGNEKMLMLYWYQSRKRIVAREYLGKLFALRDAMIDGSTAGTLVRVMLPETRGASEDVQQFASLLIPEIQRCLGH
jgi:EpsI family protein